MTSEFFLFSLYPTNLVTKQLARSDIPTRAFQLSYALKYSCWGRSFEVVSNPALLAFNIALLRNKVEYFLDRTRIFSTWVLRHHFIFSSWNVSNTLFLLWFENYLQHLIFNTFLFSGWRQRLPRRPSISVRGSLQYALRRRTGSLGGP